MTFYHQIATHFAACNRKESTKEYIGDSSIRYAIKSAISYMTPKQYLSSYARSITWIMMKQHKKLSESSYKIKLERSNWKSMTTEDRS